MITCDEGHLKARPETINGQKIGRCTNTPCPILGQCIKVKKHVSVRRRVKRQTAADDDKILTLYSVHCRPDYLGRSLTHQANSKQKRLENRFVAANKSHSGPLQAHSWPVGSFS